ncbi:IclR family transcriptional regulator [Streptomyces sp. NPDC059009]|uniref:IclR family transcriptional regulator n=1 Tax=Streptomyces sp. NPDC059009 TaxID=3346694 RepID=UPI0036AD1C3B
MAVLNAFRSGESEVTLSELARRTGLPKPTVHRLIAELVDRGYLERGRQGLRLGHLLFTLGSRAPLQRHLRRIVLPYLESLHEATRGSAQLSMPDGVNVTHLDSVCAPRPTAAAVSRDKHRSLCDSAAARVLSEPGLPYVILTDHQSTIAVSAPILDPLDHAMAAITVISAIRRPQPLATARQVRRAAADISRQLRPLAHG